MQEPDVRVDEDTGLVTVTFEGDCSDEHYCEAVDWLQEHHSLDSMWQIAELYYRGGRTAIVFEECVAAEAPSTLP